MKKAALFNGPLVAPTSSTWGMCAGIGGVFKLACVDIDGATVRRPTENNRSASLL